MIYCKTIYLDCFNKLKMKLSTFFRHTYGSELTNRYYCWWLGGDALPYELAADSEDGCYFDGSYTPLHHSSLHQLST